MSTELATSSTRSAKQHWFQQPRPQGAEFRDDLAERAVFFGIGGVDVARGGAVVVVFDDFGLVHDAAELFGFLPFQECRGDPLDTVFGDIVLGISLGEDLRGVNQ